MLKLISKDKFERTLVRGEEALNLIGYIPFVSTASAAVRSLGGILLFIIGLCFAIGNFFAFAYSKPRKIKHFLHLKTSFGYAMHGAANFFRAKIEAFPFLGLVFCLPYDRYFKKRFKYAVEKFPEAEDVETIEI